MNKYIFLTDEGYTYQPDSTSDIPDCENSQVLGIIEGKDEKDAFQKLINENEFLKESCFTRFYCYELKNNTIRKDFIK